MDTLLKFLMAFTLLSVPVVATANTVSATFTGVVLPTSFATGSIVGPTVPVGETINGSFSYSTTPYSESSDVYSLSGSWTVDGYTDTSAQPGAIAGVMSYQSEPYTSSGGVSAETLNFSLYTPGSVSAGISIPLLGQVGGLPTSLTFAQSLFDPNPPNNSYLSIYGGDESWMLYLQLTSLNGVVIPSAVPLPASAWLMLSVLIGIGATFPRRRVAT